MPYILLKNRIIGKPYAFFKITYQDTDFPRFNKRNPIKNRLPQDVINVFYCLFRKVFSNKKQPEAS